VDSCVRIAERDDLCSMQVISFIQVVTLRGTIPFPLRSVQVFELTIHSYIVAMLIRSSEPMFALICEHVDDVMGHGYLGGGKGLSPCSYCSYVCNCTFKVSKKMIISSIIQVS